MTGAIVTIPFRHAEIRIEFAAGCSCETINAVFDGVERLMDAEERRGLPVADVGGHQCYAELAAPRKEER